MVISSFECSGICPIDQDHSKDVKRRIATLMERKTSMARASLQTDGGPAGPLSDHDRVLKAGDDLVPIPGHEAARVSLLVVKTWSADRSFARRSSSTRSIACRAGSAACRPPVISTSSERLANRKHLQSLPIEDSCTFLWGRNNAGKIHLSLQAQHISNEALNGSNRNFSPNTVESFVVRVLWYLR